MPLPQEPAARIPPYEHVCKTIGRLYLESQFEMDRAYATIQELQQKVQTLEAHKRELEARIRELESRHGIRET